MTGGSAGAICWFDAGHSDSADPESFADAMLAGASAAASTQGASASGGDAKSWEYIRCGGLGVLPGLCCPHHDRTQSNGVLRAVDFDGMLRRHNGETGVCIDHFAALVVEVGSATAEARDNVRFLSPLARHFDDLASMDDFEALPTL